MFLHILPRYGPGLLGTLSNKNLCWEPVPTNSCKVFLNCAGFLLRGVFCFVLHVQCIACYYADFALRQDAGIFLRLLSRMFGPN